MHGNIDGLPLKLQILVTVYMCLIEFLRAKSFCMIHSY